MAAAVTMRVMNHVRANYCLRRAGKRQVGIADPSQDCCWFSLFIKQEILEFVKQIVQSSNRFNYHDVTCVRLSCYSLEKIAACPSIWQKKKKNSIVFFLISLIYFIGGNIQYKSL